MNNSRQRILLLQLLLLAVAAAVFFTNLGVPALWDIDEPRNAVCAREMLERGDWIVPTFNGELRAHKPILLYWLMMGAYQIFGVSEFAARFWSAALSIGTVLIVFHLARRLFGTRAAFLASLALTSCVNFALVARAATPDAVFVFCTTAALAAFVAASTCIEPAGGSARWRMPTKRGLVCVYLLTGLAVLAKGPVALVVILGTLMSFLCVRCMPESQTSQPPLILTWGNIKLSVVAYLLRVKRGLIEAARRLHPLLGVVVVAAVVGPWYAAVCGLTGGKWLSEFLFTHNLSRFMSPMENHRGPFFYYLLAVCIGLFPWSLFIYPTVKRTVAGWKLRDARKESYIFLTCWVGLVFGFFSLAATKLPSYIMPAYPALAILTGATLDALLARAAQLDAMVWLRRASWTLAITGAAMMAVLPILASIFLPGEQLLGTLGLIPLTAGILCLLLLRHEKIGGALGTFAVAAAAFCILGFGFCQLSVSRHHDTPRLIDLIRSSSAAAPPRIAGFDHFRPSWVFYAHSPVQEFFDIDQVLQFFSEPDGKFLVTTDKGLKKIRRLLPPNISVVAEQSRFMHRGKLLVLAQRPASASAHTAAARNVHPELRSAKKRTAASAL